ncbi:MAG: hypothetical protein ACPG8W_11255 [Candidatus Promineifilaceae bacterium]
MQSRWGRDIIPLFLLTAFPIHLWSYYNVMREFPAWLARLNPIDLIATIGFSQLMPFLESIIVFVPILIVVRWLPQRFEQAERIAMVFCFLMVSAAWSIFFHWSVDVVRTWRLAFVGFGGFYLVTLALPLAYLLRSKTAAVRIADVVERLNVLSAIYIAIDLVCILIVIAFLFI